jgi:ETFB lysine methyltransferase
VSSAADVLVQQLEASFVTTTVDVEVGGEHLSILKPRNADDLISEADFVQDERLPYWADVWPSSIILGNHVRSLDGTGRTLLELGCGLGIVSIMAMRAGFDVLGTDYYPDALRFTRANALCNTGRQPRVRMIDWRALPSDLGTYDMVLSSDVLYEVRYADLIAGAIRAGLARDGRAIVADPGRVAVADFLAACTTHGLECMDRSTRPFVEGAIRQTITLYSVRRA